MARAVLLPLVREAVRLELAERAETEADPIVDVATVLPVSRRTAYALARAGKIAGATKVGKKWMARRSALAALLDQHHARPRPAATASSEPWTPALALARAGVRMSGGGR